MAEKEEKEKKESKNEDRDFFPSEPPQHSKLKKSFGFSWWHIILLLLFIAFVYWYLGSQLAQEFPRISYSQFWKLVDKGEVKEVIIKGQELMAILKHPINPPNNNNNNNLKVSVIIPEGGQYRIAEDLKKAGVEVNYVKPEGGFWSVLLGWLPITLLVVFFLWLAKGMQEQVKGQMKFGQINKLSPKQEISKTTFDDVAGCDEAKEELKEVVEFLKTPEKFKKVGAKIPKGVLLIGAPGTGKTLLARAVAGEASVPFFNLSGSDFVEMFVGVGAARVRDLFDIARKNMPCIVFIDEIDAVGRVRGAGVGGGNDEREQTLNQILNEMDGFDSTNEIIVIAATNRPDILDPAILRPGRFDKKVIVPRPDLDGRKAIFKVHLRHLEERSEGKNVCSITELEIDELAKRTPGATGADIENFVNEAALIVAKQGKEKVEFEDIEKAIEKVILGAERKRIISEKEKRIIATHEAGHAIVSAILQKENKVKKVSIVPRGEAGGVTWVSPVEDKMLMSEDECRHMLATLVAGRVAEEMFLNIITSGAEGDIENATEISRKMVTSWGMSKSLGLVSWRNEREHPFLGIEISERKMISEDILQKIDKEIREYINLACRDAKDVLERHKKAHAALVDLLLQKETINGEEVEKIIKENPEQI